MRAYVLINATSGRALEVARKIGKVPGVQSADAVTGQFDVIATCEAADIHAIGSLIVEKLQKVEGVARTVTCFAVS